MITMNSIKKIMLKPVKKEDYKFLFELLEQRRPLANISHKRMPTWEEHVKFVKSKPYSKWYIIIHEDKKIGSIYLSKQNEIGIHLWGGNESDYLYLNTIKELMRVNSKRRFLVNISPKNKKYTKYFQELGFKMIQHTYELDLR